MGKGKKHHNRISDPMFASVPSNTSACLATPPSNTTTSATAADPILGYRIRVLIHDLLSVTKDPDASRRFNSTTDEHYISTPYFDDSQAAVVKAAIVDIDLSKYERFSVDGENSVQEDGTEEENSHVPGSSVHKGQTFVTALEYLLESFIDKRRASGDARPCGPHHLAPMYASLFGVKVEELKDDKFLSRLRRAGV